VNFNPSGKGIFSAQARDFSQYLIHQSPIDNFFVEANSFSYIHERRQS
jgi:hypothetical protein